VKGVAVKSRADEKGAALVMVIGVIATLAVLAAAVVLLTGNAQSNTQRDRNRAKAFNVAEAAVDYALYKIGTTWPLAADVTFTSAEKSAFLARCPSSEFGNVDVSIIYFDNYDTNGDGSITRADGWPRDGNGATRPGDGLIYIEAQASVGGRKARIQCEAQRIFFDTKFPRGIPAATDGNLTSNSSKSSIGSDPSNGGYMAADQTSLTVMAGGTVTNSNPNAQLCDPGLFPAANVKQNLGSSPSVVDSVLDPDVVHQLIMVAVANGKWYSDIASEQAKGAKAFSALTNQVTPWEGVVVVETTNTLALNGNGVFNGDGVGTNKPPGVLMVVGPHTMYPSDATKVGSSLGINLGGNGTYYGLMYTDGSIGGNGTITIVGMAMAKGGIDLAGNRRIEYNDNVVANLSRTAQLSAQIVPNTWRQIQPL
jgi:hypothetical protein